MVFPPKTISRPVAASAMLMLSQSISPTLMMLRSETSRPWLNVQESVELTQVILLSLSEDLSIIPPPSTSPSAPSEPLGECASSISLSSIVKVVELTVVVVPLTVRFPVTVKLSETVVSEVACPIVIAVPEIPVPIETDSLEFAVSTIR